MAEQKATNIVWHQGAVTRADRERLNGHRGATVWFTGLSGSGKSTIAVALEKALWERGVHAFVLDGDNVRHGLNKNLGFSPADRTENIRRIGEVAKLFADAGIIALTAFISPYRSDRDQVRALMQPGDFVEVMVACPLEVCEQRDVKGLYRRPGPDRFRNSPASRRLTSRRSAPRSRSAPTRRTSRRAGRRCPPTSGHPATAPAA